VSLLLTRTRAKADCRGDQPPRFRSVLTTDGLVPALGDYASMASPKLFQFSKGSEHSEERATLRGKRLLIAEELTEGRSIDVTALKQIQDVGMITASTSFRRT
jgi:putative DNA primase/helicase